MKRLCALAVLAAAWPAQALVDGWTLGHVEAVVQFCSDVQPAQAAKYEEQLRVALENAPAVDLALARTSKDYEAGRDAASEEFDSLTQEEAGEACRSALDS